MSEFTNSVAACVVGKNHPLDDGIAIALFGLVWVGSEVEDMWLHQWDYCHPSQTASAAATHSQCHCLSVLAKSNSTSVRWWLQSSTSACTRLLDKPWLVICQQPESETMIWSGLLNHGLAYLYLQTIVTVISLSIESLLHYGDRSELRNLWSCVYVSGCGGG